jgi:hypothetical protein
MPSIKYPNLSIRVKKQHFCLKDLEIFAYRDIDFDGKRRFYNATINLKEVGAEEANKEHALDTISITMDMAQVLMDDLWNCGLRPTEGQGSAGSLAATQKHLNDMRMIVANQLKVEFENK